MSFFCLFLFFGPAGEYGFARCSLSPDLLSFPRLFSLIGTGTLILRRLMSALDFQADTLLGMRRAHCSRQSSSKTRGAALRKLPQTKACNPDVNQILFCHAFPVAYGGHRYAG